MIMLLIYVYILLSEIWIIYKNSIVIKYFFVCLLYFEIDCWMVGG